MPEQYDHPDGNFDATVLDHGFSKAKTGTDQLWLTFETEAGQITAFLPLTDAAADGSLRKLAATGYSGANLAELADGTMLKGNRCVITIRHEEYQGQRRAKVVWINPEGWVPGPQRDESVASNAARFNGLLAKIQADKPAKNQDIPF